MLEHAIFPVQIHMVHFYMKANYRSIIIDVRMLHRTANGSTSQMVMTIGQLRYIYACIETWLIAGRADEYIGGMVHYLDAPSI